MKQAEEVTRGCDCKLLGSIENRSRPLSPSVFLQPLCPPVSFSNPFAPVSTASWYVGKAADFTGSSYTTTPQGLKSSRTMNRTTAECLSVNGAAQLTCIT